MKDFSKPTRIRFRFKILHYLQCEPTDCWNRTETKPQSHLNRNQFWFVLRVQRRSPPSLIRPTKRLFPIAANPTSSFMVSTTSTIQSTNPPLLHDGGLTSLRPPFRLSPDRVFPSVGGPRPWTSLLQKKSWRPVHTSLLVTKTLSALLRFSKTSTIMLISVYLGTQTENIAKIAFVY